MAEEGPEAASRSAIWNTPTSARDRPWGLLFANDHGPDGGDEASRCGLLHCHLCSASRAVVARAGSVLVVQTRDPRRKTILAGPVVFEPLPDHAGGVSLRVVAFGLVIVAATMTPPTAASGAPGAESR